MIWYSLSVSVRAGATVIESPVWTPIGSMFSIEQTMMQLSFLSRTTSISYSFQPSTLSSISTSSVGEASMPRLDDVEEFFAVVGDAAAGAAEREARADDAGQADDFERLQRLDHVVGEHRARAFRGRSSSWRRGTARGPRPCRWPRRWRRSFRRRTFRGRPSCAGGSAQLSAVWPPMVGSSASGRSFSMILATTSGVIGSM